MPIKLNIALLIGIRQTPSLRTNFNKDAAASIGIARRTSAIGAIKFTTIRNFLSIEIFQPLIRPVDILWACQTDNIFDNMWHCTVKLALSYMHLIFRLCPPEISFVSNLALIIFNKITNTTMSQEHRKKY